MKVNIFLVVPISNVTVGLKSNGEVKILADMNKKNMSTKFRIL